MIDGTPLLDIKPFVGAFDVPGESTDGWVSNVRADAEATEADDRFVDQSTE